MGRPKGSKNKIKKSTTMGRRPKVSIAPTQPTSYPPKKRGRPSKEELARRKALESSTSPHSPILLSPETDEFDELVDIQEEEIVDEQVVTSPTQPSIPEDLKDHWRIECIKCKRVVLTDSYEEAHEFPNPHFNVCSGPMRIWKPSTRDLTLMFRK